MSASTATTVKSDNAATLAAVKSEWKKAKAAVTKTPIADGVSEVVTDAPVEAPVATFTDKATDQVRAWREAVMASLDTLSNPEASFTRKACAYVVSLCASFGTGYLVGMAMNTLLMTAAVSASLFLTIMVWVIGLLVAVYLGSRIGSAVYDGIAHRVIEDTAIGAYHSVRGWFTTEKVVAS